MDFLPEEITAYCQSFTSAEDEVLYNLNRQTQLKILRPRMLSGHLQGQFLKMLSCMIQPENILEVGTYTGYSALCMAHGLKENGTLHTIEINPELESFVKTHFSKSVFDKKIILHIGDALEIIPALDISFEMAFIDADKENYIHYFELIFEKLKTGGYVIADNVLWSGKVLDKHTNDKEAIALQNFNKHIKERKDIEHLLLPFRDGLMIIRKM